jgi:hypothetical protein
LLVKGQDENIATFHLFEEKGHHKTTKTRTLTTPPTKLKAAMDVA